MVIDEIKTQWVVSINTLSYAILGHRVLVTLRVLSFEGLTSRSITLRSCRFRVELPIVSLRVLVVQGLTSWCITARYCLFRV